MILSGWQKGGTHRGRLHQLHRQQARRSGGKGHQGGKRRGVQGQGDDFLRRPGALSARFAQQHALYEQP